MKPLRAQPKVPHKYAETEPRELFVRALGAVNPLILGVHGLLADSCTAPERPGGGAVFGLRRGLYIGDGTLMS